MLVGYPEVFVSLATIDPSPKALLEWFVTRHANKNRKDWASWSYTVPFKKSCHIFCALIPVLHPGNFQVFCVWHFLKQKKTKTKIDQKDPTNYSTELNDFAQRTIFIV